MMRHVIGSVVSLVLALGPFAGAAQPLFAPVSELRPQRLIGVPGPGAYPGCLGADGLAYYPGPAVRHVDDLSTHATVAEVPDWVGTSDDMNWVHIERYAMSLDGRTTATLRLHPHSPETEPVGWLIVAEGATLWDNEATPENWDPEWVHVVAFPQEAWPHERTPREVTEHTDEFEAPSLLRPDGALCAALDVGIFCFGAEGEPTIEQLVDVADLDEAVGYDESWARPAWDRYEGQGDPTAHGFWEVGAPTFAPDGTAYFLAWRYFADEPLDARPQRWRFRLAFVLSVSPSGAIGVRFGRVPEYANADGPTHLRWSPLRGARRMLWSSSLDAALVWPVERWDYAPYRYQVLCNDTGGIGYAPIEWAGLGLRVLPHREPGNGYVSLTRDLLRWYECGEGGTAERCERGTVLDVLPAANGELAVLLPGTYETDARETASLVAVDLDPAALDLDLDGLTGAREAALGTSDFRPDSDGGGTWDRQEAELAGTDPLAPGDDPAQVALGQGLVQYAISPLVRMRGDPAPGAPYSSSGPLDGSWRGRAQDGSFDATETGAGIERQWRDSGRTELYVSRAELDAVRAGAEGRAYFLAADRDHSFVLLEDQGEVHVFEEGAAGARQVFDLAEARCEAGLGPCESTPPLAGHVYGTELCGGLPGNLDGMAGVAPLPVWDVREDARGGPQLKLLGWDPYQERLLVGVQGNWETWILGVHRSAPPVVVFRQSAIAGHNAMNYENLPDTLRALHVNGEVYQARSGPVIELPEAIAPTGHGDFLVSWATEHGVASPFGLSLRGDFELPDTPFLPRRVGADIFTFSLPDSDGGTADYEWVRYEHGLDPGDTLVLLPTYEEVGPPIPGRARPEAHGYTLRRIGPRGGMPSVWNFQVPLRHVSGMDVSGDGEVCVVDDVLGEVIVYAPLVQPGVGVPGDERLHLTSLAGPLDCAWGRDGRLRVLFGGDAPRVAVLDEETLRFTTEEELDMPLPPQDLLRKPDGSLTVFHEGAGGLRGMAYLPDGRRVGVRQSEEDESVDADPAPVVEIEGEAVATLPVAPGYQLPGDGANAPQGRVSIVVRPDGWLVVAARDLEAPPQPFEHERWSYEGYFGRVWVVDPASGEVLPASPRDGVGAVVAGVPGGLPVDPWSGAIVEPAWSTAGGTADVPVAPGEPTGGEAVMEEAGGGCAADPKRSAAPPFVSIALLVLLLALRETRSRTH